MLASGALLGGSGARAVMTEMWASGGVLLGPAPGRYEGDRRAIPDGNGGAFVVWTVYNDYRGSKGWINGDIYAQHVDANGQLLWNAAGAPVCVNSSDQHRPALASDGSGGIIVVWEDDRNGSVDIYAQRLASDGTAKWTADGVSVCGAAGTQQNAAIAPDGAGGAVVAWEDYRNAATNGDIYAQRVLADGTVKWTADGVAATTAPATQFAPFIASVGQGGALVAWTDNNTANVADVNAVCIDAAGTAGTIFAVCNAPNDQVLTDVQPDGTGGYLLAWWDYRNGHVDTTSNQWVNADVYMQRLDASLQPMWTANGVAVATQPYDEYEPVLGPDGAGGADVAYFAGGAGVDVRAARVSATGAVVRTDLPVSTAPGDQTTASVVHAQSGGALFAFQDNQTATPAVYAQRLSSLGQAMWGTNGTAVAQSAYYEQNPLLISDGANGGILVWEDWTDISGGQLRAQRISDNIGDVIYGDVDHDSQVTPADAAILLKVAAGLEPCTVPILMAGDVAPKPSSAPLGFGDSAITIEDAVRVMRAAVQLDYLP